MGTGTSSERGRAFFHLRSTHKLIDDLSALDPVTLYVGAGASIERTGLSWAGLSAQLLDRDLGDYSERIELVRAMSPLQTSSAIAERFRASRTDGWRDRLREAIGDHLYRGPLDQTSYFNDRVIGAANALIAAGKSVIVVTPNYDQFLIDALDDLEDSQSTETVVVAAYSRREILAFGVDNHGKPIDPAKQLKILKKCMADQSVLCIVYLHGFVGREARSEPQLKDACPVVSEKDYAVTRENSQLILQKLFTGRNVIIVGSSVTDPPLVHALLDSRYMTASGMQATGDSKDKLRRIAIIPSRTHHSRDLDGKNLTRLREMEKERASHIDVELIAPPFYFQAPQILEELRVDLVAEHLSAYSDAQAAHRYGYRLSDWWFQWLYGNDTNMVDRQADAHKFLREQALRDVRDILKSPADEALKLEAWIRWYPEERQLGLWASSTGTWPDFDTMRKDPLSLGSNFAATRAFLNGAPNYMKSGSQNSPWRSYLAKPIRYLEEDYYAHIPVGVISVASSREQDDSSINPRFRRATAKLFNYLDSVGWVLFGLDAPYRSDIGKPES